MADETGPTEAHVVVVKAPESEASLVGTTLYAVLAETPEAAQAAVQDVAAPETTVETTGGPLKPETVERLALVPGEPKQIG